MTSDKPKPLTPRREIDAFLRKVAEMPNVRSAPHRGRLLFAMDATASREPTWDRACHIQAQMFTETAVLGGLEIQLCYYRGHAEFYASPWLDRAEELLAHMTAVGCRGGYTQIEKVLLHARQETKSKQVDALVFIGDSMEENADRLFQLAGELGLLGMPIFIFQEGHDATAALAFKHIAGLSHGAYCHFDPSSPEQLRKLLSAVAIFAAGGRKALEDYTKKAGGITLQLIHQVKK